MNALFQLVSEPEIDFVLPLMHEFYSAEEMIFDEGVARAALEKVSAHPQLGQVYLISRGQDLAGYFVLTFCFSLEFHGKFALLDELYLREPFRRQKFGRAAIEFAQQICREAGVKALGLKSARLILERSLCTRLKVSKPTSAA